MKAFLKGLLAIGILASLQGAPANIGFWQNTPGGGPPALITHTGTGGGINGVTSSSINTTGANLLVVAVSWYSGITANGTISDSKSNTWSALTESTSTSNNVSCQLFYCYGATVGSGHTFTYNGTSIYASICVEAFSNVAASPFDHENGAGSANATTIQPGSITPSQAHSIIVSAFSFGANSSGTISVDSSLTITDTAAYVTATSEGLSMSYNILSSASATNPTWTSQFITNVLASRVADFKY
jgi:hypothetical protein